MFDFFEIIYLVIAALIAIVFHEMAHGYVSYKLGDPTPKETGRLSFNILHHIDLLGVLSLVLFRFGWAKPVRVNPMYYKNRKLGMVLVAIAGPLSNILIAFLSALILGILLKVNDFEMTGSLRYLQELLYYIIAINVGLGVFNLIPIPPLDGSKILGAILPERYYFRYMRYERFGIFILIGLLYLSSLTDFLGKAQIFVFESIIGIVYKILGI